MWTGAKVFGLVCVQCSLGDTAGAYLSYDPLDVGDGRRGAAGADILKGDRGMYKFIKESTVARPDIIAEWGPHTSYSGGDRIGVSGIDANSKLSGNQEFSRIGTKSFSGKAGELRYEKTNADTFVYADVNGDKKADFAVQIDDRITLYKDDFLV